jgi:Holliday junction resolvase RusA-like endonuclease
VRARVRSWDFRIDLKGYPIPYDLGHRIYKEKVIIWNKNSCYKKATRALLTKWMACRDLSPLCGAIKLRIIVLTPRNHDPLSKPDASNVQKTIEDCCSEILFGDDCNVTDIHTVKRRGHTDEWRVRILCKKIPNKTDCS